MLGSVGTQSGLVGSIIGVPALAVQAWAAGVNDRGGLNCHEVEYLLADDGGDPARHQALVQQMVEQNGVVAFLQMDSTITGQASVNYLSSRNIPVISSEGGSDWFYTAPNYFPLFSSGAPTIKGLFHAGQMAAQRAGLTRIGTLSCIEAAICSSMYTSAPRFASELGANLVYRGQVSLAQPDYTSACQNAKDSGAEAIIMSLDGNSLRRLFRSCNSVGYHPLYIAQSLGLTPDLPSDPGAEGLVGLLYTMPWLDTSNPIVAEQQEVLGQYAPSVPLGAGTIAGFLAGKVFEAAVAATDDPTTSAGITQGMNAITENDFAGVTYPLSFPAGQSSTPQYCAWTVTITGGEYRADGAEPLACGTGS